MKYIKGFLINAADLTVEIPYGARLDFDNINGTFKVIAIGIHNFLDPYNNCEYCGINVQAYLADDTLTWCDKAPTGDKKLDGGGTPYSYSEPKCECGAEKVYGKGTILHSATMPCPLFKK
jgi:hypothetical protein